MQNDIGDGSMRLSKARLKQIREREQKATTDWEWSGKKFDQDGYVHIPQGSYLGETLITLGDTYEDYQDDCLFAEEARANIPDLLAYVEFLEKALGDATGHLHLWSERVSTRLSPGVLVVHKDIASNALGIIGGASTMPELAEWLEEKDA
jgi:hypothetical protein